MPLGVPTGAMRAPDCGIAFAAVGLRRTGTRRGQDRCSSASACSPRRRFRCAPRRRRLYAARSVARQGARWQVQPGEGTRRARARARGWLGRGAAGTGRGVAFHYSHQVLRRRRGSARRCKRREGDEGVRDGDVGSQIINRGTLQQVQGVVESSATDGLESRSTRVAPSRNSQPALRMPQVPALIRLTTSRRNPRLESGSRRCRRSAGPHRDLRGDRQADSITAIAQTGAGRRRQGHPERATKLRVATSITARVVWRL